MQRLQRRLRLVVLLVVSTRPFQVVTQAEGVFLMRRQSLPLQCRHPFKNTHSL